MAKPTPIHHRNQRCLQFGRLFHKNRKRNRLLSGAGAVMKHIIAALSALFLVFSTPAIAQYSNDAVTASPSGGGTPGGTNGQVQFNNSGALGGFTMSGD